MSFQPLRVIADRSACVTSVPSGSRRSSTPPSAGETTSSRPSGRKSMHISCSTSASRTGSAPAVTDQIRPAPQSENQSLPSCQRGDSPNTISSIQRLMRDRPAATPGLIAVGWPHDREAAATGGARRGLRRGPAVLPRRARHARAGGVLRRRRRRGHHPGRRAGDAGDRQLGAGRHDRRGRGRPPGRPALPGRPGGRRLRGRQRAGHRRRRRTRRAAHPHAVGLAERPLRRPRRGAPDVVPGAGT